MLTVIIPYTGNKAGLAQLLVSLQPQLHPDDDIYIVDQSKNKSSLKIVARYGSTRCFIFVEPTTKKGQEAVKFGVESMRQNNQQGALLLPTDIVISNTFIANLKKVIAKGYDFIGFNVSLTNGAMDPNFKWFTPPPQIQDEGFVPELMDNRTSYVSDSLFDETHTLVKISKPCRILSEVVVLLS